ncbi:MAG: TRAP transporter small permease [Pseudomonadota bacterium]
MPAMPATRAGLLPGVETRVGKVIRFLAKALAILGGLLLTALAVMTVISVIGRSLTFIGLRPITGDFEMVEMGCAIAICAFLPWCQLTRGHVTVDIFVGLGPRGLHRFTQMTGDLIVTAIAAVLFWRFWLGMGEMISNGQETYLLGLPIWFGYVGGIVGIGLFLIVSLYTVWRDINDLATGVETEA